MPMPGVADTGKTSCIVGLWDEESSDDESLDDNFWDDDFGDGKKENIFSEALQHIQDSAKNEQDGIEEFVGQTLPTLARHFDGKALDGLKQANQWLAAFEPGSIPRWEKAKSASLDNGPAFLDVLASFTDSTRFETQIGIMLSWDITFFTRLLLRIRDELDGLKRHGFRGPQTLDQRVARESNKLAKILGADKAKGITRRRIEALLRNCLQTEEWIATYTKEASFAVVRITCRWIFALMWDTQFWFHEKNYKALERLLNKPSWNHRVPKVRRKANDRSPPETSRIIHIFRDYILCIKKDVSDMKRAHVWIDYTKKVQSFVRQVGCAKIHDGPEENIAELRLFHSTTIGYFAKLQDQYLKKEIEVKKLRHHITALEFRYLLEHLPDIKLHQDAGPRWMRFWENALNDEADNYLNGTTRVPDHALESIVEKRNPKRKFKDQTTGTMKIHTKGTKGYLHITGENLYSILSDEIHRYRGGEYEVGDDDGWTEVVTEVLRALKPLEASIDAKTREVDWAAERRRYTT